MESRQRSKTMLLPATSTIHEMMAIGLDTVLKAVRGEAASPADKELREKAVEFDEHLGMPSARVEKDLNLFRSNSERMQQAVELMEETLAAERRKREQQDTRLLEDSKLTTQPICKWGLR